MSESVLYRKFRPQNFDEVVGQEHIVQTLREAVLQKRIAHSYLFAGPRGTGKTSVARILAKSLNCEEGITPEPCDSCSSCISIKEGRFMDVVEIDAASNRGIDEIRALRERVHFTPSEGRYKVYIIDEVHMLTNEAFNALLKTLEEPPLYTVFVLATTEVHKVPETIVSRCQHFDFHRIPPLKIVEKLKEVALNENIKVDEGALKTIALQSGGSLRDALVFLEQLHFYSEDGISSEDVLTLLGKTPAEILSQLIDSLKEGNISSLLSQIESFFVQGFDFRQLTQDLLEFLHQIVLAKSGGKGTFLDLSVSRRDKDFELSTLLSWLDILEEASREMRYAESERLTFELALIRMIKLRGDSPNLIEARLNSLEEKMESLFTGKNTSLEVREEKLEEKGKEKEVLQKPSIDLDKVKRIWPLFLSSVKKRKVSTYALLLECEPKGVEGDKLLLSFKPRAEFHYKEMMKPANMKVVEEALKESLQLNLEVCCEISEKGEDKVSEEKREERASVEDFLASLGAEEVEEFNLEEGK
jgi:DNA polymerase-3 subunit gamma/tau